MYTLTLIAQKGGTGKTTLAINLSVAAELDGWCAAFVDIDPQASAAGWGDHRHGVTPAVATVPASRLADALEAARGHGADLAVIDSAPHSESAVLDLRALGTTADICSLAAVASAVVLNQTPSRGPLADQAAEAAAGSGLEVSPCRIGYRVAFQHSLTNGLGVIEHEPDGKAAEEIRALFRWARARLEA